MQSVTIGKNQAGQRLDKFLHKYLPFAGTGFLYKMLRKKNITLNGKKAQGSELLALNDEVQCFFSDETFAKFSGREASGQEGSGSERGTQRPRQQKASDVRLGEYAAAFKDLKGVKVLYEDEDFLFLDKPAGMLTQKAAAGDRSLNEWMIGYLLDGDPAFAQELETFRPGVCNRLDRNTSGIVLCGKSLEGLQYLGKCIKERRVRKLYRTICAGRLEEPITLEGFLEKDGAENKVRLGQALSSEDEGVPLGSASYVRTVCRPLCAASGCTLVEVELITGKSHQIRAHLASIGHPLIGDGKYGRESVNRRMREEYGLRHQLLHACQVQFPEETSGAGGRLSRRIISSPCPQAFLRLQAGLGLTAPEAARDCAPTKMR